MLLAARVDLDGYAVGRALEKLDAGEDAAARAAVTAASRRLGAKLAAPRISIFKAFAAAAAAAVLIFALTLWPAFHRTPVAPPAENNSLAAVANEVDPSDSGKLDLISAMAMDKDELDQAIVQSNPERVMEAHLAN
jgi:hypothetical protein